MYRAITVMSLLLLFSAMAWAQVVPPVNLTAELQQAGQVELNWEEPPDGLVEDFNDGEANGFDFYTDAANWQITNGWLQMVGGTGWQCAWYTEQQFEDFTLEAEILNVSGTGSRGLQFRADGPRDDDYNGFNFYMAMTSGGRYCVYRFINGTSATPVPWTTNADVINDEMGASNTVRIVGQGNSFEIYINDTLVNTFTDDSHPSGMVGAIATSSAHADWDYINCYHGAVATTMPGLAINVPTTDQLDEEGNILSVGTQPAAAPFTPTPLITADSGSELDEFIEYRVYRDGSQIGTADSETYTDQLPGLGEHSYNITAFYDEGESSFSNTAMVNWEIATLDLTGDNTVVPPSGGDVTYGVHFTYGLGNTVPGVGFWTMVDLPNGQEFGPLFTYTFTVQPFMDVEVFNLVQSIPALAPAGVYTLNGHVGFNMNSQLEDGFEFEKIGTATNSGDIPFNPSEWTSKIVE